MRDTYEADGPAGRLDVRAHGVPEGPPVVLCHPHPLHGGSMGSRLVYDLAVGLGEAQWRAYRLDFRGVGRSECAFGRGVGEAADAVAVLDMVAQQHDQAPVVVGHSFGAAVALSVATQRDVAMVVTIGLPLHLQGSDLDPLADAARVPCPVTQIRGSEDEHVSRDDMTRLHEALRHGTTVELAGAGHFLEPSRNGDALRAVLRAIEPIRRQAVP